MSKTIITSLENRTELLNLLKVNKGLIILKFGASWCKPCKLIEHEVHHFFMSLPDTVICGDIDIDESFDVYAYLKSKRMVIGIPAIVCYKKGNITYIPDDFVSGTDKSQLQQFFSRCINLLHE